MTVTAVGDTYLYQGRSGETLVAGGVSIITGAAGTTAGTPMGIGGVYISGVLSSYTTGQRTPILTDANGNLRALATYIQSSARNIAYGFGYGQQSQTGTITQVVAGCVPFIDNGSTLDAQRKANATARLLSSAATTNAGSVKASAGDLFKIVGNNTVASKRYLKLYNKATAPTVGTDTPVMTIVIPASASFDYNFSANGQYFATGIAFAITGAAADADTTAIGAGDIECLNFTYA